MRTDKDLQVLMIRFLYRFGFLDKEEVFAILNTTRMRTWQRINQLERILDVSISYNAVNSDE